MTTVRIVGRELSKTRKERMQMRLGLLSEGGNRMGVACTSPDLF